MPEIVIAEHAGFCFGVSRAAEAVEASFSADSREKRYTLGKLIHNDSYIRQLEQRGIRVAEESDLDSLAASAGEESPVRIFIRAHGIARELEKRLLEESEKNPFFTVTDCTCPFVKKIHKIAEQYSDDGHILAVVGQEKHPEVVGILSRFDGEKYVFDSPESLENAIVSGQIIIFAVQTTFNLVIWQKSQEIIKNLCTNYTIFDTICNVTELRQKEAETLSHSCDSMIVVGGKESSNTAKLFDVCRSICRDTIWIETADELRSEWISLPRRRVGIVAGASTPVTVIEGVHKTMSEMENFEELLEQSLKTLNTGDIVTGTVTAVLPGELQLDIGGKVTGRIEADQITDDPSVKLSEMFKIGDEVEAFVIRVSDVDGFATLSKKRVDSDKNWQKILAAKESNEILEGKVIEVVKGGVVVLSGAVKVFVPASQTGIAKDGDLNVLLGTTVRFKVIEIKGRKAIGSIRLVAREERKAKEKVFWDSLEEGQTFTGTVKSMTSYGAFIDLGGVDGMVHVTELSWKRLKSPADVLKVGDEITVFVKSFDKEARKISLGYKTEDTNPWFIFKGQYAVGDVVSAKIVSMMPFGAFAEIIDGVTGLIHISQIAQTRIAKPADVLELGQTVDAKILSIDDEKKKVSLSIRALLDETNPIEETAETAEAAEAAEETIEAAPEEVAEETAAPEEAAAPAEENN